jgi:hypothetical protein
MQDHLINIGTIVFRAFSHGRSSDIVHSTHWHWDSPQSRIATLLLVKHVQDQLLVPTSVAAHNMDAVGDTYAISESDFQDAGPAGANKHSVAAIVDMMKKLKLPKLPQLAGRAAAGKEAAVLLEQQLLAAVQHRTHEVLSTSRSSEPARACGNIIIVWLVSGDSVAVPTSQQNVRHMPGCSTHVPQQAEWWHQRIRQTHYFTYCK